MKLITKLTHAVTHRPLLYQHIRNVPSPIVASWTAVTASTPINASRLFSQRCLPASSTERQLLSPRLNSALIRRMLSTRIQFSSDFFFRQVSKLSTSTSLWWCGGEISAKTLIFVIVITSNSQCFGCFWIERATRMRNACGFLFYSKTHSKINFVRSSLFEQYKNFKIVHPLNRTYIALLFVGCYH